MGSKRTVIRDESNLPGWAQERLALLRGMAQDAPNTLEVYSGGTVAMTPRASNVFTVGLSR